QSIVSVDSRDSFGSTVWVRTFCCGSLARLRIGSTSMGKNSRISLIFNFVSTFDIPCSREVVISDSKVDNIAKDYLIPDYILLSGSETRKVSHIPAFPVLVFINTKSGGQLGGELLITYRNLLNKNQVVDLGENTPEKVLHQLYLNLEKQKNSGDSASFEIQRRLRLIVAGGDGTAGWLLGVISNLKLSHPPPVATVPLGTGNNLPFSFGWGKKNPGTDRQSVMAFLDQIRNAKEMKIDSWHILMQMKAPKDGSCDPIAPLELPHSLHAFQRVYRMDTLNKEGYHTFHGGFWNYFSMGMDAQVSYAFHRERKLRPEKFKNQLVNQSTYAKLGVTQGWFCASLFHPASRNIAQLAKVKIMRRPGQWVDLHIPHRKVEVKDVLAGRVELGSYIGASGQLFASTYPVFLVDLIPGEHLTRRNFIRLDLICLLSAIVISRMLKLDVSHCQKFFINLLNIEFHFQQRDLTLPYVDDGLIEVVGFRDAWHGFVLFAANGHGTRLAQASTIRFEFNKGAADHTFMRVDGEPWKQPLPMDDDIVVVEISHFGQVSMLANPHCRSKSVNAPYSPCIPEDDDHDSCEEDDLDEKWEERKRFGAADTF
ncbi:hypothetical protein RJ639_011850, partial [Escallonia herrerae]